MASSCHTSRRCIDDRTAFVPSDQPWLGLRSRTRSGGFRRSRRAPRFRPTPEPSTSRTPAQVQLEQSDRPRAVVATLEWAYQEVSIAAPTQPGLLFRWAKRSTLSAGVIVRRRWKRRDDQLVGRLIQCQFKTTDVTAIDPIRFRGGPVVANLGLASGTLPRHAKSLGGNELSTQVPRVPAMLNGS